MHRPLLAFLSVATLLAGCGPMTHPMVSRLTEDEQAQVDEAWTQMFLPPERLDRSLLLDVLLSFELHQVGVDRLALVSEKRVGQGRVIMTVNFDRASPAFDEFTIAYVDEAGCELRRERYTSAEIMDRLAFLFGEGRPRELCWGYAAVQVTEASESGEEQAAAENEEAQRRGARSKELEARVLEIQAATQPAEEPRR